MKLVEMCTDTNGISHWH